MSLRLDWCSYAAAKYAVEHWHYSRCMPVGKNNYIGVWESGRYVGAVIFGIGSGGSTNGTRYQIDKWEIAELTRVALSAHEAPVSRVVALAIKLLRSRNMRLRLLVSLADPMRGHVGAIYQAGNWLYTGQTGTSKTYIGHDGREYHERVTSPTGQKKQFGVYKPCLRPQDALSVRVNLGKHRYLMPLDDEMRQRIEPLRKPYPKRSECDSSTATFQAAGGGAIPTRTLQENT